MAAFVYLLRCTDRHDSLYCGWTTDVQRRLAEHQSGRGARFTSSRLPVELVAQWEFADAFSARREEARIKRLTRSEKLQLAAEARRAS